MSVALRKESVDRNKSEDVSYSIIVNVALRKESVDRNTSLFGVFLNVPLSLSARRAWIEIEELSDPAKLVESLSARRAWIEMIMETPWLYRI